jgi:hypothetical protein
MRKTLCATIIIGLCLISASCSPQATQTPQPKTETPLPTTNPTEAETSVPTATPTETETSLFAITPFVPRATSKPKFAPFCESHVTGFVTPSQCQVPIAEQSSTFCSKKTPYNLIIINQGSTYETPSEDVKCSDAGLKDGKQIVMCTGPMATNFELTVCDPACALPTFHTDITDCPEDYKFDSLRSCCTQRLQPADQNCVVLKLRTTSCVIDCAAYNDKTTCNKNGFACSWDDEFSVCLQRK